MNPINFCYWLRGALEIMGPDGLTKEQLDIISKHLDLVLTPVTQAPSLNFPPNVRSGQGSKEFDLARILNEPRTYC